MTVVEALGATCDPKSTRYHVIEDPGAAMKLYAETNGVPLAEAFHAVRAARHDRCRGLMG